MSWRFLYLDMPCVQGERHEHFLVFFFILVLQTIFRDKCMLSGDLKWANITSVVNFEMYSRNYSSCTYPICTAVLGCILYGIGITIYYTYATVKSHRDPQIG